MPAQLQVEAGQAQPALCHLLAAQTVTLGRHPQNTVVLEDEHASRWHAMLVHDVDRWMLCNIGAPVNGTLLDGQPLAQPTALRDGQLIEIGDVRLRVAVDTVVSSVPVADTPLRADELTALCHFMASSLEERDASALVRRGLQLVLEQTRAALVGFLSLDPEAPVPRLILPDRAQVDVPLSRQLTQQVQRDWRPIWLAGQAPRPAVSDSLASFSDALCLPLGSVSAPLGALHVYRSNGTFGERNRRFCEVLAGHLTNCLRLLRSQRTLEAENLRLRSHLPIAEELLGDSPAIRQLRDTIARVASRPSNVLIQGESGVGKELVALALHRHSPRGDGPLVVVNCAAIAATLPEAELFGHTKGAFTGADRDRPGLFLQADEGTLFLDEIGDLPLDCQAKLLRVIEGKGYRPVGATAELHPDVRVLAATNRDLDQLAEQGKFRHELLFRLRVIDIRVPPLREHAEDIPILVRSFLDRLVRELRRPLAVTAGGLHRLQEWSWPGNVRQLWAVLESTAVLCDKTILDAADLRLPALPERAAATLNLDDLETWAIREALRQTQGNVSRAAKILGVVRDTLTRKMKIKGIVRKE